MRQYGEEVEKYIPILEMMQRFQEKPEGANRYDFNGMDKRKENEN